jgi:hypothetical protein
MFGKRINGTGVALRHKNDSVLNFGRVCYNHKIHNSRVVSVSLSTSVTVFECKQFFPVLRFTSPKKTSKSSPIDM